MANKIHPDKERESSGFNHEVKSIFSIFFPEVSQSKSCLYMLIWITIYAISLVTFVIQFRPLVLKYLAFGVTVSMSIENSASLDFPQVTVCTENIFEKSKIRAVTKKSLYQLALLDDVQAQYIKKVAAREEGITLNDKTCPENWVLCRNITQCIPSNWICDEFEDCEDKSDELESLYACSQRTTAPPSPCFGENYRSCNSDPEECAIFCNGDVECEDESDEENCVVVQPTENLTATLEIQSIVSHEDYPEVEYPENIQITFNIAKMNDTYPNIEIKFEDFLLEEKHSSKCFDYIEVLDANNQAPIQWQESKQCGFEKPSTIIILAPVTFTFYSDRERTERGFEILFIATDKPIDASRKKRNLNETIYNEEEEDDDEEDEFGDGLSEELKMLGEMSGNDWRDVYYNIRGQAQPDFSMAENFAVFDPDIPYSYGVSLKDLIIDCKFGSASCRPSARGENSQFTYFMNAKFGKCYLFNSAKGNRVKFKKSAKSGINNGLSMVLFINQAQNIGLFNKISGVSINLNLPKVYPLPHRNSVIVKPGSSARISIKQKKITRIPYPYSKCANAQPNWQKYQQLENANATGAFQRDYIAEIKSKNASFDDPNDAWTDYNQQVCYEVCLYNNLREECGCVDSYLYMYYTPGQDPVSPYPICSPWDIKQIICKHDIYLKFRNGSKLEFPCNCPQACADTVYDVNIASDEFPSKNYLYYFMNEVMESSGEEARDFMTEILGKHLSGEIKEDEMLHQIRENFVRVEIYYEELNFEQIKENKAYSIEELISAFAGNIGMFVGWSVLTFSHVILTTLNLIQYIFCRCSKK